MGSASTVTILQEVPNQLCQCEHGLTTHSYLIHKTNHVVTLASKLEHFTDDSKLHSHAYRCSCSIFEYHHTIT